MRRLTGYAALAAFAATIPVANWLIANAGTVCVPQGPCLIPVAPGLMAPSGVLVVGASLVLRDVVHHRLGVTWALGAITAGAALSGLFAPGPLVVASVMAFLLSELADLAVYAPLQRRRLLLAVALSGLAGSVIDSAVFLWLAFGDLSFLAGQVVGKLWMTALALPLIRFARPTNQPEGATDAA